MQNLGFAAVFLFLAACGKEEIKVYSVPKENTSLALASTARAEAPVNPAARASKAPIGWTMPSEWQELAPTSMRVGNFLITKGDKKAEVTIIPLSGLSGTELDNINRWRGEIGLPDINASEISSEKVSVGSEEAKLYDLAGPRQQTLATMLKKGDATWFFKMRGDKELVLESKSTFVEFLKSIGFDSDPKVAQASRLPPVENAPAKSEEPSDQNGPKWDVPSQWQEKAPGPMVLKSFSASDSSGNKATISISQLGGTGGGPLANVNRWRGQLSLQSIEEAELSKITTSVDVIGGKAMLVDMKGTDGRTGKPARMMAAMVPQRSRTWFYKMTGDDSVVEQEKERFTKFVQTVRYPNE